MHRSRLGWTDFSLNLVTGCRKYCSGCYAAELTKRSHGDVRRALADPRYQDDRERGLFTLEEQYESSKGHALMCPFGFAPTRHRYRHNHLDDLKHGHNVAVCPMGELFGPWVPTSWTLEAFEVCAAYTKNNYLFRTCYPGQYIALDELALLPHAENYWYGVIMSQPGRTVPKISGVNTFASFTPLLADFPDGSLDLRGVKWAIIGAGLLKRGHEPATKRDWVQNVVAQCRRDGIPVFMENSLNAIMGDDFVQEFPAGFDDHPLSDKTMERYYTGCGFCKREFKKADMTAAILRKGRRGAATTNAYICDECLEHFKTIIDSPLPVSGVTFSVEGAGSP